MRKIAVFSTICAIIAICCYVIWQRHHHYFRKKPNVDNIAIHLEIQRLEEVLFGLETQEEIRNFLQTHSRFASRFLGLSPQDEGKQCIAELYRMTHDPGMGDLHQEVQRVFGDLTAVREELTKAFKYLKYYYPDFEPPLITTFITGMGTDLYVSSDLIVIGLDFFLGEDSKYRPLELPQYILRTYQPTSIVPKIMLLLSQQFIKTQRDNATMLADMLCFGKACCFAQAMLPDVAPNILLGYTDVQLAAVAQNQDIVWEHFIEQELLYTTDHEAKRKYLHERPFTGEIDYECPGSIGRWLGWEILKRYMQRHPQVSLPALMADVEVQKLFTQAKYRPQLPSSR